MQFLHCELWRREVLAALWTMVREGTVQVRSGREEGVCLRGAGEVLWGRLMTGQLLSTKRKKSVQGNSLSIIDTF